MLQKQYTSFLNTSILNRETGEELGEVYDLIVDTNTGKIEAFWVKQGLLPGAEKILSIYDIAECKIKVYVQDEDSIINPEEILKVQKILEKGVPFYLNNVKTLSGTKIGKVTDFFFDCATGQIMQFQVAKSLFGFKYAKRLIAFSEIYKVTKKAVILKNDYKYTAFKIKEVLDLTEAISN